MARACPACTSTDVRRAAIGGRLVCQACSHAFLPEKAAQVKKKRSVKRRTTRGRSDRQEKNTARTYSGRTTLNSGAMDDKADVVVRDVLRIEDKTTLKRSYSLKLDDLLRLQGQTKGDEMPVLKVCFEDNLRQQYCIIPEHWFVFLLEESGMLNNDEDK